MRVEASKQAASRQPTDSGREFAGEFVQEPAQDQDGSDAPAAESRALVVTGTAAAPHSAPVYREAAFLAHLIATKAHAPQTRERRRAEPSEAIAAYRTVNALTF
ncbi:MAG: hypothetical protein Q7V40_22770 [Pseudolabrys sp.]|nr:hypothetical protein [Pseudolabrys sp.]